MNMKLLTNPVATHNVNMKRCLPTGARKTKYSKSGRWSIKKPITGKGICFDLQGPCSGPLGDVMELGRKMAEKALDEEDRELAQRCINRLKIVPREYELEAKKQALARKLGYLKETLKKNSKGGSK